MGLGSLGVDLVSVESVGLGRWGVGPVGLESVGLGGLGRGPPPPTTGSPIFFIAAVLYIRDVV